MQPNKITDVAFLSALQTLINHDPTTKKYLLAVSGGMDSAALAYLYHSTNLYFAIAHVNFNLRGAESDADEAFVAKMASKYKVPFYVYKPDTLKYAAEQGVSIQMAARELRYTWFHQLRNTHQFDFIVTAHHRDDASETILLNLLRGSGLSGLAGIRPHRNFILRPLIQFSREQIHDLVASKQLTWREDSSNQSTKYLRNFLRIEIFPKLAEKFEQPALRLAQSAAYAAEAEEYILEQLETWEKNFVSIKNKLIEVPFEALVPPHTYLAKRYFMQLGIRKEALEKILEKKLATGAKLISNHCEIFSDRCAFFIRLLDEKNMFPSEWFIYPDSKKIKINATTTLLIQKIETIERLPSDILNTEVFLPLDALKFPLKLRYWKAGDRVKPLGMQQYKKISDVLIDKKIPKPMKDTTLVLLSEDKIAWILGILVSEDFKIKEFDKPVLHIKQIQE